MTNATESTIGLCDYGLKILSTILNLNNNSVTKFTSAIKVIIHIRLLHISLDVQFLVETFLTCATIQKWLKNN